MMLFQRAAANGFLAPGDFRDGVFAVLERLAPLKKILIVPPDITRFHSGAGTLTRYVYEHDPAAVAAILPALGTHAAMSGSEIETMFGDLPKKLFKVHNWRRDCARLGEVPADFVKQVSDGAVDYPIPIEMNRLLFSENYDCIISIGQVVPHEVAGMAGHNKNLFVGLGGVENIHKSHFLGAAFGIERILGKADSPVRAVMNYAIDAYCADLPIVHVLTVMGRDSDGSMRPVGLFIGKGRECFEKAAALSAKVNMHLLDKPLTTVVVNLDPMEYKSFWLGNKSIYRTRMAIADSGKLIVLAPGVKQYGEDPQIDKLIREFGYKGTPATMRSVNLSAALKNNLSAAAHLIHGSSEGRFSITYCTHELSRQEVERVGFAYAPAIEMLKRYDPATLKPGANQLANGEEIYYIPNPAIGLWAWKEKFV
jgi:nickel-dependent lactate racemase